MKTFLSSAAVAALILATPFAAMAQQTVGDNSSGSTSNSGSASNAQLNNQVGPSTSSVGPIDSSVRVGPSTSESESTATSLAGSSSVSAGGHSESDSHAQATGGTSSAVTGPSTSSATNGTATSGNAQNITFNNVAPNKQKLETVPQVYAPALTTTLTETCMGSTSGGVSVMGFGGTLGTTWNDSQCVRRLNARELAQTLGDREAARALMCQDKDVAAAYAAVGQPCAMRWEPKVAVNTTPPQPLVQAPPPPPPEPPPPVTMKPIPNPPEKSGERGR